MQDADLADAEAAEGAVRNYVLGGITGLLLAGFAGFCAVTGQTPVEVATAFAHTDLKQVRSPCRRSWQQAFPFSCRTPALL